MKLNHEGEYICECENWEEPVLYPVAELIRCRKCKWYEIDKPHYCGFGGHGHRLESDFCSDAERKEE